MITYTWGDVVTGGPAAKRVPPSPPGTAKLLTAAEFYALNELSQGEYGGAVRETCRIEFKDNHPAEVCRLNEYNIAWRMWQGEPTQEQMMEAGWDDEQSL